MQKPMPNILRRDEVVKRHAAKDAEELRAAIDIVNAALENADKLPHTVAVNLFGSDRIRNEVLRQLKDAGWTVTHHNQSGLPSDDCYEIK